MPEEVRGKPDSYRTNYASAGFPLPPFAGGALAGAFLSSFLGSAGLLPLTPAANWFSSLKTSDLGFIMTSNFEVIVLKKFSNYLSRLSISLIESFSRLIRSSSIVIGDFSIVNLVYAKLDIILNNISLYSNGKSIFYMKY